MPAWNLNAARFNFPAPTVTSTSASPEEKNYRLQQFFHKKAPVWVLMVWGCRGRHFVSNSIVIWWLPLSLLLPTGNFKFAQRKTNRGRSNWHSSQKKKKKKPWIKWFTWKHPLNVFPKIPQLNRESILRVKKLKTTQPFTPSPIASSMQIQPRGTGFNPVVVKGFCHSTRLSQSRPKYWFPESHTISHYLWHRSNAYTVEFKETQQPLPPRDSHQFL